ncbi:hypothetical protein BACPEC_00855 [[Bacteroides] pectinophilus ATCC 43243]|jgi:hypothetical protein|uniref:Uncharacterized protein n=1 Tax=[Bacteroides] pectinophilus ATCC 43243 TaxID=483218 RepID=B7AQ99_9FIRM|nr:hypothetical protein BACPEC_00855 [[Bacteroides] pectinophilus ATCC 43243]
MLLCLIKKIKKGIAKSKLIIYTNSSDARLAEADIGQMFCVGQPTGSVFYTD